MAASYAHKTSGQNFWLGDRGPFQPPGRPMAARSPSFRGIWPSLQKLETLLFRHLHIIYLGLSSVLTLSHKHTLYLTLAHVHARTHSHVHVCTHTHTHAREALIDGSHEVISQNERNACKLFFFEPRGSKNSPFLLCLITGVIILRLPWICNNWVKHQTRDMPDLTWYTG